jgi:uncharacterized protein (TIGR02171 family)
MMKHFILYPLQLPQKSRVACLGGQNSRVTFASLFLAAWLGCSPTTIPSPEMVDKAFPGMRCIYAKGRSFSQGAGDALASASDLEKPPMSTSFGYNYWIDTVEVTQKEYYTVRGRTTLPDSVQTGRGDDYPVSFVSWYDAVLFCNAKSGKCGLDTVYSFSGTDTVSSGSVVAMRGLLFHYERNGWRLPTEAEWEFAAREGGSRIPFPHLQDSAQAKTVAWFDLNSSNAAHPVSRLAPNAFGLYDMAGNVFEWTADWKGPYARTAIINSIGAPNPDDYLEKTLKGGSFKHSFLYLRPSRRAGTYQASLSTKADFIGFRCARGTIAEPRYYTPDSTMVATNPFSLTTTAAPQFLGTPRAKIAFVNVSRAGRNLCAVDFGRSPPASIEFTDVNDAYDPAISPDGRFVAYSNRGEGFGGPATTSIRRIDSLGAAPWKLGAEYAYVPRWWIDPVVGDTFLVYVNSAVDNQNIAWPSTKTFLQKMSGGRPSGEPGALFTDGSFHDGLSALFQYAVTGYTRCIMRDMVYNMQHQLFVSPYNGKDASGSTQVCNVSISSDPAHPDRCLFLDFGSQNKVSTLVNEAYGVHEYLFIAEFDGNTVAWYKRPGAESSWDYPEWSNKARFAVSSCRNAQSDAHAVYCINLEDKTTLQVLEGTELSQPCLWIGALNDTLGSSGLSLDSLGVYGDPYVSGNQVGFSYNMHRFWNKRHTLDIAFVGNSQVEGGIDCAKLPAHTALNLGYPGVGVTTCSNIIRNYILPACPAIKLVGMSAAVYWLGNPGGEGDDSWETAITQSKGYQYDLHHNFWRDSFPARFDECIAQAPFYNCSNCDTFGLVLDTGGNWGGPSPDLAGGNAWDWKTTDTNFIDNFNALVRLLGDCAAAKVQVLMINFPESPAYKNTDHYQRPGPSWATGKDVVDRLKSLETTFPNFHFYDAYNNGDHDYTDADAGNWNHLNPRGAAKLTSRLDSLIRTILPTP